MKSSIQCVAQLALVAAMAACGSDEPSNNNGGDEPVVFPGQPAQVTGRIVDDTGAGIPNAAVTIHSNPVEVATDPLGQFVVTVAPGEHSLVAAKYGREIWQTTFDAEPGPAVDLGDIGPDEPYTYSRLLVHTSGYESSRFDHGAHWISLTVEDELGFPVPEMELSDFVIEESLVDTTAQSTAAEAVVDVAAGDIDSGFWEKSVGSAKLDVVFLVDGSGSMDSDIDDIRDHVTAFVGMLDGLHIDYQVAAGSFDANVGSIADARFYNSLEADLFLETLNTSLIAIGETWRPTVAYDAVMWTPFLDFRPGARKVVVLITDIVPQTVYGNWWYAPDCTAATRSAVEHLLIHEEIELYFSQNPEPHTDIQYYVDSDINPRPGDLAEGLKGLATTGLATELPWPFTSVALVQALGQGAEEIVDSRYLLSWQSSFGWSAPVADLDARADEYELRVTVTVADPIVVGEEMTATFANPVERGEVDFTITVEDESGAPIDDVWAAIELARDARRSPFDGQLTPVDGVIAHSLPTGQYQIRLRDSGQHPLMPQALRGVAYQWVDVPPEDGEVSLRLLTAERDAELARARGPLRDLEDWRLPGDPFRDFCRDGNDWLDTIEADGVTWDEMVALKRFTIALSGYANMTEYAQVTADRAVEDFQSIIYSFIDVIKQVKKLQKENERWWQVALANAVLDVLYAALSHGEVNELKSLVEAGLKDLITYAAEKLQEELQGEVISRYPVMEGSFLLVKLTTELIKVASTDGEADWSEVMNTAKEIFLTAAFCAAREAVTEGIVDEILDQHHVDDQLGTDIKKLVRDLLKVATDRNREMDDVAEALEHFANEVGEYVIENDRDEIVARVEEFFDHVDEALAGMPEATGDFRDFVVGFTRDLALQAIPTVEGGRLKFKLNKKAITNILLRHAIYNVILRHLYADEVAPALARALEEAKQYSSTYTDRGNLEHYLGLDMREVRIRVGDMQTPAWNALAVQEIMDNWANALEGLTTILGFLEVPLDVIAALYPALQDMADAVHGFVAVLDGIQILSQATAFGLEAKSLSDFGDEGETLYQAAFAN